MSFGAVTVILLVLSVPTIVWKKKYFETNIDMFDFADITKKEFDKYLIGGQIQINSLNGYTYYTLNGKLIKGVAVTKKGYLVKNGVIIKNTPYIIK